MSSSSTNITLTSLSSRSGPDTGSDPSGFTPGASPPLILAFLAIGLFALSMLGVFGWRRVHFARMELRGMNNPEWGPTGSLPRRTGPALGPKPQLWDLWTLNEKNKGGLETEEPEAWDTIMPIAVAVLPLPTFNGDSSVVPPVTQDSPHIYHRAHRPESAATADTTEKRTTNTHAKDNDGRLQVAVAIAMPYQRIPHDTTGTKNGAGGEEGSGNNDTFEYTLGIYECSWRQDNG